MAHSNAQTSCQPQRATRREWIGLAVIALPCLLYAMDLTVLTLAVPVAQRRPRPSSTELLWIVDIYGFLVAGFLITMGTLGDRIGRRRLLLIGAAAFGAASVLAAFSSSPEMLIASRALLGIAGATLAPSTLSLIRNMFEDDQQRTVAIGIWITSFSVGAAIGPLVGGVLLESFHWGSVFLLAVPVMALLLAIGPRLLPEYKDPEPGRLDLASAALSLVAVLAVIYGIKAVAKDGIGLASVAPILAGLAVGAAFVDRQRRLADPMIDLGLFRRRAFSLALSANTLAFAVVFGIEVFVAQYFQLVLGYSPLEAGLWSVPGRRRVRRRLAADAAARGAGPAAGRDARRDRRRDRRRRAADPGRGGRRPGAPRGRDRDPLARPRAAVHAGRRPRGRKRSARASRRGVGDLGDELGAGRRPRPRDPRHDRHGRLPRPNRRRLPRDVPAEAAGTASDTLGGAVEVADRLPQLLAADVLEPAREAFTQGLQVAATVSGVLVVAAAVLVARLLRRGDEAPASCACAT